MRSQPYTKGDIMVVVQNGKQTNSSMNIDRDRTVSVGEVFDWKPHPNFEPVKIKVVSIGYPMMVEEVEMETAE
ncbi:hypothetical protein JMA_41060 (plasmid) [Jeotgalibacillus malaysiensis]|uniref:Uncharacterized protein n=1 Tax=Jeotgalibacillus malaysiensis TaxID=1508404 RepID=A0A0B5AZR0_9BACL|nr:hypothetical protein [Jeotgalibacillus malaysiensis]AJD93424.1 hypothetical protein JMA_41060 [Jeotgalibacillus malaysiensis]